MGFLGLFISAPRAAEGRVRQMDGVNLSLNENSVREEVNLYRRSVCLGQTLATKTNYSSNRLFKLGINEVCTEKNILRNDSFEQDLRMKKIKLI